MITAVSNKLVFFTFAKLSLLNLGNGYMIIEPLRKNVVEQHKWIAEERFQHLVAKAQLLPGAFSFNLSAMIGREVAGRKGAALALSGTGMPLLFLFLLLVSIFSPMRHWAFFASALNGLRPAIIALLAASAYRIGQQNLTSKIQWLFPLVIAIVIGQGHLAPVYAIALTFAAGFIYGKYIKHQL